MVRVVRTDIDSHVFIVEYGEDKRLYRLPMLPYQRKEPSPGELQVVVDRSGGGSSVHLTQDYEKLVRSFYNEGEQVEFAVQRAYSNYYILAESHGFTARIPKELIPNPALTPRLLCRIEKIQGRYISVQPVRTADDGASGLSITDPDLDQLLGNVAWNVPSLRKLMLGNSNNDLFDAECHQWIVDRMSQERDDAAGKLADLRQRLLDILETTDMLACCNLASRNVLESRFTNLIEQTGYYLHALDIVSKGTAQEAIDKTLNSLGRSSFVYHARKQFYIMLGAFQQKPSLMKDNIQHIIDIIRKQNAELSKREPFGKLWIMLLELFISQTNANPNELNKPEVTKTMIQALALQLNLAENYQSSLFDPVLNRSLLYRLCSKMGVTEPRQLLEESLYNLVSDSGDQALYAVNTDDATLTANIIANQVSDVIDSSLAPVVFNTDNVHLMVKEGEITLSTPDATPDNDYQPLPTNLNLWHNLTIRLGEKPAADLRGNKNNTLPHFKQLWNFIYQSFFSKTHLQPQRNRQLPRIGDDVNIIITKKLDDGLKFQCRVIDEDLEEVTGYIDAVEDIVYYYPGKLTVFDFELNGRPLILYAHVKSIGEDGYHFTMRDDVTDFMEEFRVKQLNFNSTMKCILNNATPGATRIPAISDNGLSLSVGTEKGVSSSVLTKGKVVEVFAPTQGVAPYINVTYKQDVEDTSFSVSAAFHQLMINYAYGEVYLRGSDEEAQRELTTTLDKSRTRELMSILESYAELEDDNIKAYNYISVCRIMARMLGSHREEFYVKRLALIELLNDFALNNSFSQESLRLLDSEKDGALHESSPLFLEYQQMKVLSWLNNEDHNDDLYHLSCQHDTPILKQLAALVLSHNTIKKAGLIPQAEEILEKIRSILKLRRNESNKKFYGKEDYKTEFKTSIVYPESSMRPDIGKQTQKILSEICAFMNADGGTLYLGVNDQGVETGVEEDLKQGNFKGSTDRYEDYVNNQVAIQMSQEAAHNIHTHWDKETKSNVLIIDIKPTPNPVSIRGEYYERMGKSARRVNEEYLPIFLDNRRQWAAEHQLETVEELRQSESLKTPEQPTTPPANTESVAVAPQPRTDLIQTSRLRNNVIHDYEPDFVPVAGYICFIDRDEYKILQYDDYKTEDYLLELAVHEEERGGWLVMVYEDGAVVKTSLNELLNRDSDRTFKRFGDKRLIYASIASDDDLLVLGFIDGKGNRRIRLDDIESVNKGSMQSFGDTLCDVPNDGLHYVEIVHRSNMPPEAQINTTRKDLGLVLKTEKGKTLMKVLPGCKA